MNDITIKNLHNDEAVLNSKPLHKMFSEVPRRYDYMNRLLTLGFDESWRKKTAIECLKDNPQHVMDLCTGTGDLALRLARLAGPATEITGLDFSTAMLDVAREKASGKSIENVSFVNGDVAALPYPDGYFDVISVGFAFRNMTYHNPKRDLYLAEILRVIKPGGKCVIIETSQPQLFIIRKLCHLYHYIFVGKIGALISGHKGAYKYLAHSAIHYYNPVELSKMLTDYGFTKVTYRNFLFGVTTMYMAQK